ncbi:MAG TPA: hypothetical protein VJ970_02480 [Flavobacteriaceae bacterium]|nr:hypothetical protein [Flavobacteriaceae bacterium]
MTFKQRLPYYLAGFIAGIAIVYFIFDKKETEFNYGPNARVLKNIRTKKLMYSNEVNLLLTKKNIDTLQIAKILENGNVDMWNKIQLDTCTEYKITGRKKLKNVQLMVQNCDSTATITKIIFQ